jgi:hypothetical protein
VTEQDDREPMTRAEAEALLRRQLVRRIAFAFIPLAVWAVLAVLWLVYR